MTESTWLALVSCLLTINVTMLGTVYRDISRRLDRLEKQDAKLSAAVLTLLVAKSSDHNAVANALHDLLAADMAKTP